ncbi:diguanylate cyclase, partial [Xanthomonas citri]
MWSPVIPPGLEIVKPTRLGAGNPELLHLVDAAASGGPPLMIFHVDIDHFASINENMSGEVGDQALTLAARRLQEFLGARGKLWRHGSDEMVVVAVR